MLFGYWARREVWKVELGWLELMYDLKQDDLCLATNNQENSNPPLQVIPLMKR
jgi:hypothetical protein